MSFHFYKLVSPARPFRDDFSKAWYRDVTATFRAALPPQEVSHLIFLFCTATVMPQDHLCVFIGILSDKFVFIANQFFDFTLKGFIVPDCRLADLTDRNLQKFYITNFKVSSAAFVVDLDPFGFRVVFQQFKIAVRLDFVLHFFKCTSRFADAAGTIVYEVSGGSIYRSAALMAEDDRLFHSLEFALNSIIAVARPANHLFILLL